MIRESQRPNRYQLAVADFDGTVARTFEPSPNGIGVEEASRLAVQEVLGEKGLREFDSQRGLRNRAPEELIAGLMPTIGQEERLAITEAFNTVRLGYTRKEQGTRFDNGEAWPRPVPGYFDFYRALAGTNVTHIILSSGHNKDIAMTYNKVWGMTPPIIFASEKIARLAKRRNLTKSPYKPSPLLMELIWEEWRETVGKGIDISTEELRKKTIYIGDDPIKDGGLAAKSRVDFILLKGDDAEQKNAWKTYGNKLGLVFANTPPNDIHSAT